MSDTPPRYALEFYTDEAGDEPVLRWLREELSPFQPRALGVAMAEILQVEGIGVCQRGYGKQLGGGLFEVRLRHDAAEILKIVGKPFRVEPAGERILLRVFCHAHGDRLILLLGGYDKGADPSPRRQQREIEIARSRLADFLPPAEQYGLTSISVSADLT
ncbi:type II toxin-antitoxin system RelE/ParE family toxin [Conexibacter sp. DBS9H8]|uniref:type II toxin-antitoxin system RelE/ParE family toxin n=1 Tax=Conexibacter sp. DBS9H8 TaxID=2937801 RepID=UPI00200E0D9F|nr:type II toxin-antitoxin system RelE/ParE family toxin [Conexibacter sp. DBS9H8]